MNQQSPPPQPQPEPERPLKFHDTAPKLVTTVGTVTVETRGGPADASADDIAELHGRRVADALEDAPTYRGGPGGFG